MALFYDVLSKHQNVADWAIVSAYRGSIAHGMYVPKSDPNSIDDKDVITCVVPPLDHYYGLREFGSRGTQEIKDGEWDIVVYEARKLISLLAQGNPNVLSLLWLDDRYYIKRSSAFEILRANRGAFVGRHVYRAFTGYAYGQLHRMTHSACEGYMGAKRKALVEQFGYDTKNAAHLIRLLRMGVEFLRDGELYVLRPDAAQLLEIKRGEWTLEQVRAEADRWFRLSEEAYIASTLPASPDMDYINSLAVAVVQATYIGRSHPPQWYHGAIMEGEPCGTNES